MPHAQMTITVDNSDVTNFHSKVQLKMEGCQTCLVETVTAFLLADPEFKLLINKAVRAANEQRQKKEN